MGCFASAEWQSNNHPSRVSLPQDTSVMGSASVEGATSVTLPLRTKTPQPVYVVSSMDNFHSVIIKPVLPVVHEQVAWKLITRMEAR